MLPAWARRSVRLTEVVPCADLVTFHAEGSFVGVSTSAVRRALECTGHDIRLLESSRALLARRAGVLCIVSAALDFTLTRAPSKAAAADVLIELAHHLQTQEVTTMNRHLRARRTGIIFAADLPNVDANSRILDQIGDRVDVIKIGSPLVYAEGMLAIRRLKERHGLPVFADLKISDVPHTNAKIIRQVADHGGDAVMVHGIIGPDGLADAIDAAEERVGVIVQLELTNPGGKMFTQPIADDMASMAAELSVYGFQAPGNRPERVRRIREIVGPDKVIVCCGVGYQGGTCESVFAAGADYAIVGRAIYDAERPVDAISALLGVPGLPAAAGVAR